MPANNTLDLGSLIEFYEQSEQSQEFVAHNAEVLRCIRGGLRLAERYRIAFDPRRDYWYPPERRFIVAYFGERWTGRFAPASKVRTLALRVFQHFERMRSDGLISYLGVEYDENGGTRNFCNELAAQARRLPPLPEWGELQVLWPKLPESAGEAIALFMEENSSKDDDVNAWEPGFKRRFPWFGYLGADSHDDLRRRQAFFYGMANLWTTSNAYRPAAQMFAPVLQNTPYDRLLDTPIAWASGTNLTDTKFMTLGKDDESDGPQDRSGHSPVLEVYGFLTLQRAPFYNNLSKAYRDWFWISEETTPCELTQEVGRVTAAWLNEHPGAETKLSELFDQLIQQPLKTRIEFETVEWPKVQKRVPDLNQEPLDAILLGELTSEASQDLDRSPRDKAMMALHLILDSKSYLSKTGSAPLKADPRSRIEILPGPYNAISSDVRRLPDTLRPVGERALAYLRAGLHILFAGAPGTGKTTLAQFVGHAWNQGLDTLPDELSLGLAPLTTVGNSAWSPFHTIGGLIPRQDGSFDLQRGIFIDPTVTQQGNWRLRNEAIVLDEMNRADLDRCIGELYPLLSGSVCKVTPAGLPGIGAIENSARFRVIATVNDTNLDDIVFPISEGLARRFQRVELQGCSRDEIANFLGLDLNSQELSERHAAAQNAVGTFFELARELGLFSKSSDDDRLPFGVGYFALVQAWVAGRLDLPGTAATAREEALTLVAGCLQSLARHKRWDDALRKLLSR